MAYSDEEKETIFSKILQRIEGGEALRNILKESEMPATDTFYIWIDSDESGIKSKRYTRACDLRADNMFEDLINIADDNSNDTFKDENGNTRVDNGVVQRSRLRVEARKWALSKLNPKKYGDKTIVSGDADNPVQRKLTVEVVHSGIPKDDIQGN